MKTYQGCGVRLLRFFIDSLFKACCKAPGFDRLMAKRSASNSCFREMKLNNIPNTIETGLYNIPNATTDM
jgi:hypothetical protein